MRLGRAPVSPATISPPPAGGVLPRRRGGGRFPPINGWRHPRRLGTQTSCVTTGRFDAWRRPPAGARSLGACNGEDAIRYLVMRQRKTGAEIADVADAFGGLLCRVPDLDLLRQRRKRRLRAGVFSGTMAEHIGASGPHLSTSTHPPTSPYGAMPATPAPRPAPSRPSGASRPCRRRAQVRRTPA